MIFLILAACSNNHSDAMDPSLGNQTSVGPTTRRHTAHAAVKPQPMSAMVVMIIR